MLKNPIVINNFQKGLAQSSYFGFEELRCLNINDKPGVCYPNLIMEKNSGTVVTDLITKFVKYGNDFYGISSANLYKTNPGQTFVDTNGHSSGGIGGMESYKGYIIMAIADKLDAYNGTTFNTDFATSKGDLDTATVNPMYIAQDDALYIGCGRYLAKLSEVAGQNFTPGTTTTFNMDPRALDLPEGVTITGITELGNKLYLATSSTINNNNSYIYPWDTLSDTYNLPIIINEPTINQIITLNNLLYINAGYKGTWYVSNGSSVQQIAKFPETMVELGQYGQLSFYNNAICTYGGIIYFGVSAVGAYSPMGIWSLNPSTNALNFEYLISAGIDGSTANHTVTVGALLSNGGYYLSSWADNNATFGVDYNGSTRATSDTPFIISQFYRLADVYNSHTFTHISIQLTKPLTSGDSVKVWYRTAQNGSWTLAATMSTVGLQSQRFDFAATCENIQFKIAVNKGAELLEVMAI